MKLSSIIKINLKRNILLIITSIFFVNFILNINSNGNQLISYYLSNKNISGREAADVLEKNGVTVNKNGVPNDPRNFIETSGIRLGTAAEVTRGHDRVWFSNLGKKIVEILNENSNT